MNTKLFYCFTLIIILSACASQSPLTGGDKDYSPPKLTHVSPPQQSVNLKPKQIDFEFDEFIQIRSLQQKMIISPPLNHHPQIKQKPKGFSLIINDTLLDNTTYQLYFSDAIVDLNEGNPLVDFSYVFSTGEYIDSLAISGKIIDALTHKPEALFSVCLYADTNDSVIFKQNPQYISKTNNDGFFKLTHLKSGQYKLIAFNDKNNNYRFDPLSEKIAFSSQTIPIEMNLDSIFLYSFTENRSKLYIKKTERKKLYHSIIVFNHPSHHKPLISQSSAPIYQTVYSQNNDTLQLFFSDSTSYKIDTIKVSIQYTRYDSLLQELTIKELKNLVYEPLRLKDAQALKPSYKVSVKNNQTISSKNQINISFSEPTQLTNQNISLLVNTKDTLYETIPFSLIIDEYNPLKYTLEAKLLDGRKCRMILHFDALTSFYGHSYKNDTIDFMTYEKEEYGNLNLSYILPENNNIYFFELLNEKNQSIFQWTDSSSNNIKIDYLLPGRYSLRCIDDKNRNLRWDSGFYILKRQPEKVYIYPQTIQLRANWDLELKWEIKD